MFFFNFGVGILVSFGVGSLDWSLDGSFEGFFDFTIERFVEDCSIEMSGPPDDPCFDVCGRDAPVGSFRI